ncbi:MAG: hypothetical protein R2867_34935 [Caldilineaceae bacterium]
MAPYDAAYCVADKPAAIAALEWLRTRMWDEHVMAGFSDVQYMSPPPSAFINQRVAMVEEGSWVLHEILLNSDFRVGVAPLPKGPAQALAWQQRMALVSITEPEITRSVGTAQIFNRRTVWAGAG